MVPLSPVSLTLGSLPYLVIVLVMLLVEVVLLLYLVPRRTEPPTQAFGILVTTFLGGSAGALLAVFWAVLYPNLNSLTLVFEGLGVSMGFPPGLWMISVIVLRDSRIDVRSFWWPATVAGIATLGEVLMGLVFAAVAAPSDAPLAFAAATLVSPWYLWSSATAMLAVLWWIPLDRGRRAVLTGLALSGVVAPWVQTAPVLGAALMTAAMGATFGAVYAGISRPEGRSPRFAGLLPGTIASYLGMTAAGIGVVASGGSDLAVIGFGAVMTAVMFGELRYLVAEGFRTALPVPGEPRPAGGAVPATPTA